MSTVTKRMFIVTGIVLLLAVLLLIVVPKRSKAQEQLVGSTYSKVTLYSNDGNVIGTWTAVGLGRMDGNTFVFDVYRGAGNVYSREVRINGTFTVEQTAP